jgi:hypothetical protein
MIEVTNPLSAKKVYFLGNDTILCIKYGGKDACSSVHEVDRVENYINSLEAEFFSASLIDRNILDMSYLIAYDYVDVEAETESRTFDNHSCSEVTYNIDYTNISLSEAARFGIGSNSPSLFLLSMCVDNKTGYRIRQTMNYSHQGATHTYSAQLLSFQPDAVNITLPQNISEGAVDLLFKERTQQTKLAKCFTGKQGSAREKCVADLALVLKRSDLCDYSGSRRDRCLVSLVPSTRNESICTIVNDLSYKDDCYTEIAGAFKNSTYCSNIQNASKVSYCMDISKPKQPSGNQTSNDTKVDMLDILNYMENYGKNNTSNSTG